MSGSGATKSTIGPEARSGADAGGRLILPAACLGMLVLGINGTAIMAALPTIRAELELSSSQLEWAINAYLIVSAASIIPGGKMCDQMGARRVSLAGLALFALASVVVATAYTPVLLLAGRALQGLAAALAVPGTLAAVSAASVTERRAAAIGAWAGFLMLGFSLGPLFGGALTHYADWRVIFWTSCVTMLIASGGFLGAAASSEPHGRPARFDWIGFVLLAIFMASLVSALHDLATVSSAPLGLLSFVVLAAVAGTALLVVERRVHEPLIALELLADAAFLRAVAIGSIAMSCILTLLLFYNLAVQSPRGLSLTPVAAGLSLLPMSCGLLIFAFSAPRLAHRFGPRRLLCLAMLLIVIGAAVIAVASAARSWVPLLFGLFIIGIGLALPYATAPRLALATLPAARAGAGSGIINACTFLGGSIGVALGAVFFGIWGLSGAMALIGVLALIGAWLCRRLAASM